MEFNMSIADPIHIFDIEHYKVKTFIEKQKIEVVQKDDNTDQLFYQIKKGEKFTSNSKLSFINYLEKSFDLIHPSLINLSGYSITKPYLYYQYLQNPLTINDIPLTNENIQKILYNIASCLSYLLYKGYCYSNFTINSILFDSNYCPKFIDYINFEDANKCSEKDLIIKYADIVKFIINKKMKEDSTIHIDSKLKTLIERCIQNNNLPSFEDFIEFFKSSMYFENSKLSPEISDEIQFNYSSNQIEKIFQYFQNNHFGISNYFKLNSLPENCIKKLFTIIKPYAFIKYLYNEDISLFLPKYSRLYFLYSKENPIIIYKELMKQINKFENQKNETNYFSQTREIIDYKIDALRIQAIFFLKKASKQFNNAQIKIELVVQYIKGFILPFNFKKALYILNSINTDDEKNEKMINQMKQRMISMIESNSIKNIIKSLPKDQKEKLKNAEKGDILSLLYVGFAFYTGFNEFPISRSLSIHYYREASKKSPDAMALLGYLYFKGIIFPQNLRRARNCFKRAADDGCLKAKIIDGILRKHLWKSYLLNFDINDLFTNYIQSFKSFIPNDSLVFPKVIYQNSLSNKSVNIIELNQIDDNLLSNKARKNNSIYLESSSKNESNDLIPMYSEKILLSSENFENTKDVSEQMQIALSYFNGENGFPINYSKAAMFLKLAADNGNSEAQWRYAMLCINSIGSNYSIEEVEHYLKLSSKNSLEGKFYYALFIKDIKSDPDKFEQLIVECCDSGYFNAMYYYAMHLEQIDLSLKSSIIYYKKAVDHGHFDSLIRLINLYKIKSQNELFKDYLVTSVGILNEEFLVKLIHIYDKYKKYKQSNILIQIGININYQLFNIYYIDHLLYNKGMEANIERAKKLAILAFNDNYSFKYQEKYIYLMLQALVLNNEHQNAVDFLLNYRRRLNSKYTKKFSLFYQKLDKNLARKYLITPWFCCEDYLNIYDLLKDYNDNNISLIYFNMNLLYFAKKIKNPFAMAILGKKYKQGSIEKGRNLKNAVKYFYYSAQKGCSLGCYYLGKEYFHGRYLDQNYEKAKIYLLEALDNNEIPQAGYYLYKTLTYLNDESADGIKYLKIGALNGHKRALYKYGHLLYTGKDKRVELDKEKGIKFIKQASKLKYKKAQKFCVMYKNHIKEDNESSLGENESISDVEIFQHNSKDDTKNDANSEDLNRLEEFEESSDLSRFEDDKKDSTLNYIDKSISVTSNSGDKAKNSDLSSANDDDISELNNFWF